MNLPNKLTLLRVLMIPAVVGLMMTNVPLCQILAAAVFGLASLTDLYDGYYARKYDMVTDFGKLMDPMADKLLVMAALIGLVAQGRVHWLAAMLLLGREFIVSGVRLVAAAKGKVVAADAVGKWKTVTQMVALILILLGGFPPASLFTAIGGRLLWASVALSVWSCVSYVRRNLGVFKT
ncbi:CDP-diacylglycerol--glycerol-3-phosphate 3-phosphatidyltransferase [Bacillota bacterium Meth-B3]